MLFSQGKGKRGKTNLRKTHLHKKSYSLGFPDALEISTFFTQLANCLDFPFELSKGFNYQPQP
jgi:hypothetical protein